MIARMTCASVTGTVSKCGHTWELDENEELFEDHVQERRKVAESEEEEEEEQKEDELEEYDVK